MILRHPALRSCYRRQLATAAAPKPPTPAKPPPAYETVARPKRGKDGDSVEIRQLDRPIGQYLPPSPGENDGSDTRSLAQRKKDFQNYERHLERRKELSKEWTKSYFQDFSDMRHQKGKLFLPPRRTFKADKALYFPNLRGRTLLSPDLVDTSTLFANRLSLVTLSTNVWADRQIATFLQNFSFPKSGDSTPENFSNSALLSEDYISTPDDHLSRVLGEPAAPQPGTWQLVAINLQENLLKYPILLLSLRGIRRQLPEEQHARYLIVRKGVTPAIKESLAFLNERIGYIYVVDAACRIRWAGCADAGDEDRDSLRKILEHMVLEERTRRSDLAAEPKP
ncbi:hypothetical protein DRE_02118 [Drechslerella stenobrocha 248]|uniref:Mitochondrial ATPase complex subunit ATP10 n=1 Tax=Drechslerella stenobrocha 248 TaxID=1043628 RepID=W7HXU7_9PEZI|nr:hypothetical protein DRE_02118 [Drechslerella stenobrocha 248]